jgi:hypothetical protein
MTKVRLLAIALLISSPIAAWADEISYTCMSVCSICGTQPSQTGGATYVNQSSPNDFTFKNECGASFQGSLDPQTGRINIPKLKISATISPDKKTIQFSNGTVWSKP